MSETHMLKTLSSKLKKIVNCLFLAKTNTNILYTKKNRKKIINKVISWKCKNNPDQLIGRFHNKITESDSKCSHVANLANFIVIIIVIMVIQ